MSAATVEALVAAAHARGMLAIAHADSAAMARMFIQAGGDALAHVLGDLEVTPAFLADLRRRPAFVIATLRAAAVLSAAPGQPAGGRTSASWPAIRAWNRSSTRPAGPSSPGRACWPTARARVAATGFAAGRFDFDGALRSVAALHQAGLPVPRRDRHQLPRSAVPQRDHGRLRRARHHAAPRTGTAGPGRADPADALAAATSVPARLFGLADRGRIAPGLRADLLLVDGDPCADITATRNIAAIWRNGARLHREP